MLIIIGLVMIYSVAHFFIIQKKAYELRTKHEVVVTWIALISIAIVFLETMFKN